MRGGTLILTNLAQLLKGLSPHARGNRGGQSDDLQVRGPIPACAGEPHWESQNQTRLRAYPRMRGGTRGSLPMLLSSKGLSPHARGNPTKRGLQFARSGPIPACAGEPCRGAAWPVRYGAYPRMRGGTGTGNMATSAHSGLSPHARGNHREYMVGTVVCGPIPACAGEPTVKWHSVCCMGAYPRMRGGTFVVSEQDYAGTGLSPHARGNPLL